MSAPHRNGARNRLAAQRTLVLSLVFIAAASFGAADWHVETTARMGTRIEVRLWANDHVAARAHIAAAIAEIDRIEADMSTYIDDSMLSKVNAQAATRPVMVTEELFGILERSLEISALTRGAFDITYDSIGYLYDFRAAIRPSEDVIGANIDSIDFRHVILDAKAHTVAFARDSVRLNLGGIAKGYTVERVAELLVDRGVRHAMVTAGGDTRLVGDRRGRPWIVGIRDPDDAGGLMTRVPLIDEAISTSGDYERFFDEDGVRYHHILNPSDGRPADSLRSVTVIGPHAMTTDALSTSLFVLGVEAGLALIERIPDYEAVLVEPDRAMHFSSGLGGE